MNIDLRILTLPSDQVRIQHEIRVDEQGLQLTNLSKIAPGHLNYLVELQRYDGPADRGIMLYQQLCQIEGVSYVAVTPYGCVVLVGARHDLKQLTDQVKSAVAFTLQQNTPWATYRREGRSWRYHFGSRLLAPETNTLQLGPSVPRELLTSLGQTLLIDSAEKWDRIGVKPTGTVYPSHFFIRPLRPPFSWVRLDQTVDELIGELVGAANHKLNWS